MDKDTNVSVQTVVSVSLVSELQLVLVLAQGGVKRNITLYNIKSSESKQEQQRGKGCRRTCVFSDRDVHSDHHSSPLIHSPDGPNNQFYIVSGEWDAVLCKDYKL